MVTSTRRARLAVSLAFATQTLLASHVVKADDLPGPSPTPPAPSAARRPPPAAEPDLPPIAEARPALPPEAEPVQIPWHNHLEVGGGFALAEIPAHLDGNGLTTPVRFDPGPGFHLDISWQILRYLRFTGYMSEHDHVVDLPAGSLMVNCGGASSCIEGSDAHMYSFGFRLSPTLPLGKRVRLWATAGVGWGLIQYPRYTVAVAAPYTITDRAESFFEIPLGVGGSVELIPRWLCLRMELTGSFVPSQIGDALQTTPAINGAGLMMNVGAMPKLDAAFLQTIGLSLSL